MLTEPSAVAPDAKGYFHDSKFCDTAGGLIDQVTYGIRRYRARFCKSFAPHPPEETVGEDGKTDG